MVSTTETLALGITPLGIVSTVIGIAIVTVSIVVGTVIGIVIGTVSIVED